MALVFDEPLLTTRFDILLSVPLPVFTEATASDCAPRALFIELSEP